MANADALHASGWVCDGSCHSGINAVYSCICVHACVCTALAATNPGIDVRALEHQILMHIEQMHNQITKMGALPPPLAGMSHTVTRCTDGSASVVAVRV